MARKRGMVGSTPVAASAAVDLDNRRCVSVSASPTSTIGEAMVDANGILASTLWAMRSIARNKSRNGCGPGGMRSN